MVEGLSLAVVVAHPDDEAYGMAGSVALHAADPGFRFILVHATDGGAGEIREGFPATRATLGAIRRQEDEAGWRALGRVPDRHVWLGYPDGELDRVPADELTQAVSVVLDDERPTVVATSVGRRAETPITSRSAQRRTPRPPRGLERRVWVPPSAPRRHPRLCVQRWNTHGHGSAYQCSTRPG